MNLYKFFTFIIVITFSFSLFSKNKSVNPKYTIQNLHYLHKDVVISADYKTVDLKGPRFMGRRGFDEKGESSTVDTLEFLKQSIWALSVFPSTTGKENGAGTGFYVGGNFVLTNKHVLQTTDLLRECGSFDISVRAPIKEKLTCKEVLYCSDIYDFCLVEMNDFKNGTLLMIIYRFKLGNTTGINEVDSAIIGNSANLGIQGSKEIAYIVRSLIITTYKMRKLLFTILLLWGSSGGL